MRFRKLRIAFSATCLIACLLLIVLWVRSYSAYDVMQLDAHWLFAANSEWGECGLMIMDPPRDPRPMNFIYASHGARPYEPPTTLGFRIYTGGPSKNNDRRFIVFPHWFAILMTVVLAIAPLVRFSKRFSLRTLLIATTLVAVLLGLVVWAARK